MRQQDTGQGGPGAAHRVSSKRQDTRRACKCPSHPFSSLSLFPLPALFLPVSLLSSLSFSSFLSPLSFPALIQDLHFLLLLYRLVSPALAYTEALDGAHSLALNLLPSKGGGRWKSPPPHPHPLRLLIPTKANRDPNVVHQIHQYGVIYRLPPSKKAECFLSLSLCLSPLFVPSQFMSEGTVRFNV